MNQMMKALQYPFDAAYIMRKRKALRKELLKQPFLLEKKIAVLGGSTTHDIKEMLELFLLNYGIRPVFYESEYAQYWQDAMFGNEALAALEPDLIFIHTTNRNITAFPELTDSRSEVDELLEQQYRHFEMMWEKLADDFHCPLIQNNFEYPYFRLMGNQDASSIYGRTNFIARLNQKFYDYAGSHENFYINDINYQSADFGLKDWLEPSFWHMYKYALSQKAVPVLAYNAANIIKSVFGKNKKALALDLDHTLWGGIVGDDGAEGLEIGPGSPQGEAYAEFQAYLKALRKQGILLGIISKNEKVNALAGLNHPQMVLKPDEFVQIKADWEPKSLNLKKMASELALLPESFVFVDDNPAEREIIRQQVPQAAVAVLDKPEHYIYAIDRAGYFEMTSFSADDLKRNEMYRGNAKRKEMQNSFSNYKDYLLSLDMHAEICPFQPVYMARIAQLTNKSNQFNLTTKRYTQDEIEHAAFSSEYITLYGKLEDRFGDNGVVSALIGRQRGKILDIELWIMSCRVLKRDMEYAMMDALVQECRKRDIHVIYGYYYPTAKNSMVKDFYGAQGFEAVSKDQDGNTVWMMNTSGYQRKNDVIKVNEGGK